jgi:hypothetical protein
LFTIRSGIDRWTTPSFSRSPLLSVPRFLNHASFVLCMSAHCFLHPQHCKSFDGCPLFCVRVLCLPLECCLPSVLVRYLCASLALCACVCCLCAVNRFWTVFCALSAACTLSAVSAGPLLVCIFAVRSANGRTRYIESPFSKPSVLPTIHSFNTTALTHSVYHLTIPPTMSQSPTSQPAVTQESVHSVTGGDTSRDTSNYILSEDDIAVVIPLLEEDFG